ncbi:testicular haploid expressed gene protein isoform X1 [Xiphophorus maculatus]|uniref:testicular haploid expressed gene protein isoform X1 n=1 Tax=Xiphophorus maculatus TaxID=8083 RepID=UPI000C6DDDED|nr:testicular haploid expressed gene protein isoform X1 [Xiphophorus maculatus]
MGPEIQQPSDSTSDQLKYLDRQTVQWLERKPSVKTEATKQPKLAPTWADLTRTRTSRIRLAPKTKLSKWALHAFPSERLCQLAQPRPHATGWQPELPLPTPVSKASLTAVASPRICKLAQPRMRCPEPEPNNKSEPRPITHLTSIHLSMLASEFPRAEHPLYQRHRSACWPVSISARNYIPSKRLLELSCPKIRKDVYDGYDPFVVSHAALCVNPSPRTLQLSVPLPRKCTPKVSRHYM